MTWTEDQAIDAWLADLEAEAGAAELVRDRLERPPVDPGSGSEACFREAATRWLERGQAQVALALLERGEAAGPTGTTPLAQAGGLAAEVDVLLAARPGGAGLPALTEEESAALREAKEPEEALRVLRGARARLELHGEEARRLLRRWLERREG